jgi:hypothetical protein
VQSSAAELVTGLVLDEEGDVVVHGRVGQVLAGGGDDVIDVLGVGWVAFLVDEFVVELVLQGFEALVVDRVVHARAVPREAATS